MSSLSHEGLAIEVAGVHKWYGDVHALKGVDLSIERGARVAIVGPSGSGKSTLLRTLNHLERVDAGRILVNGRSIAYSEKDGRLTERKENEIAANRQQIGMVFQDFNLFGHLSVLDNVMLAPRIVLNASKKDTETLARQLLASVGLGDKEASYPAMLSGGQQQRTAIARALAMRPSVMLFDEPTSALDAEMSRQVLDVIRNVTHSEMTSVIVTHELGFAREVATEVVFMEAGKVVESGPPEVIFERPRVGRTEAFIQGAFN